MIMLAPSSANSLATVWPIPVPLPVTKTTLFANFSIELAFELWYLIDQLPSKTGSAVSQNFICGYQTTKKYA
jgi:hypothetical protein